MARLFDGLDADDSGELSLEEVREFVRAVSGAAIKGGGDGEEDAAVRALKEIDHSGDGSVSRAGLGS